METSGAPALLQSCVGYLNLTYGHLHAHWCMTTSNNHQWQDHNNSMSHATGRGPVLVCEIERSRSEEGGMTRRSCLSVLNVL